MPLGVPFKDRGATVGRPRIEPRIETELAFKSTSKSLARHDRVLRCGIKQSVLYIDVSQVFSDKIRVKRADAIAFANWILDKLEKKRVK